MKTVVKKGYTLEVTSWENDGDNYRTKFKTVESEERAKALVHLCKNVFASNNNGGGGIGNLCDGEESTAEGIIMDYLEENTAILPKEGMSDDDKYDYVMSLAYDLLGGSEWYVCRICESVKVTYSAEDIKLQEVNF